MSLAPIDEALRRIRRGEMVLVVDDEDRENEGDLTMAASWVTPEAINFMLRWARGLVCMPATPRRARGARRSGRWCRPTKPAATPRSRSRSTTSTPGSGIGAADRALTIRRVVSTRRRSR